MKTEPFDPREREVYVDIVILGPLGSHRDRFLFDTGSRVTVVDPSITDRLGYGAHMGQRTTLVGIDGVQEGYRLRLQRFEVLGVAVEDFAVWCYDFHERTKTVGLLGMDFLEGRVLTIDGIAGRITLGP